MWLGLALYGLGKGVMLEILGLTSGVGVRVEKAVYMVGGGGAVYNKQLID